MKSELPVALAAALLALVVIAAYRDLRSRRIPNWLTASGIVLGLGLNTFLFGGHGFLKAAAGMFVAGALYLGLYALRGMGAGDVKLMAAVGALAGPGNWLEIFIATALAGGAAAAVFALSRKRFLETCTNVCFLLKDLAQLRAPHKTNPQLDFRNPGSLGMPHGLLIALGSVVFLVHARLSIF